MILFTRFRSAAPDSVFLATTIPSLALLLPLRTKKILKYLSAKFSARITWLKPSSRNNRCAAVNSADRLGGEADMLNRESGTALGAASLDHSAASACLHAHQKSMGAFSFGYGRLICAFHVLFLVEP